MDPEEYHKRITSYIKNKDDEQVKLIIKKFTDISTYVSGAYDKDEDFEKLSHHLGSIEATYQTKERNRIFYLALPPSVFISVTEHLKKNCYVFGGGVNRIIIEKPFGKDTESCKELIMAVQRHWTEDETFRIDHYLGKEMVKNILVLRFANIALGAAWDKNNISNVQITFKEPFGTEGRGGYFDEFGIIRDILQNREFFAAFSSTIWTGISHLDLLQVLTVLTMERPVSFSAEDIRDEKVTSGHLTNQLLLKRSKSGQNPSRYRPS